MGVYMLWRFTEKEKKIVTVTYAVYSVLIFFDYTISGVGDCHLFALD